MQTALTVLAWMAVAWVALGVAAAVYALALIYKTGKELKK